MIETAFVLPIILLLGLLTVDVGRGIFGHIALTQATQEGALYAAYRPFPTSDIITRVNTSSNWESVADATVTVPSCTTSPAPGRVVVHTEYDMPLISPLARLMFGDTLRLAVQITATNFNGACS